MIFEIGITCIKSFDGKQRKISQSNQLHYIKSKKEDLLVEEGIDPITYRNGTRKVPPSSYKDGPIPTISDILFSLIILINLDKNDQAE